MRWLYTVLSAALLVGATASGASAESPRSMMFEFHLGPYTPQVDRAFTPEKATPYADLFSDETMLMFGAHMDYQLFQGFEGSFYERLGFGSAKAPPLLLQSLGPILRVENKTKN